MYSGGVPTRHTQMGRPTYEAPTREYYTHKHTNTNTNKHKQTHNVARQSTVRTHAVAAPSSGPYIVHLEWLPSCFSTTDLRPEPTAQLHLLPRLRLR
jgi:hypothetical protein